MGVGKTQALKSERPHFEPVLSTLAFFFSFLKIVKFPSRFKDMF